MRRNSNHQKARAEKVVKNIRRATPRDLALSPSGRRLIVANQDSDTLTVFAVDQQNGTLSGPIEQRPVGTPMAIKIAAF